jgi:acyl-CoA thioester hydrolase
MESRDGVFEMRLAVAPEHIDENRHVNNVQYVQWMQDVAVAHSDERGCTGLLEKLGGAWVARSHRIEYLRPALSGDNIVIKTWVSGLGRVRSTRKYCFVREADGVELARAETEWVFVDRNSGRPKSIPKELGARFRVVGEE